MATPTPATPTLPSTYVLEAGTLIEGGATVTFLTDAGLSAHTVAAVVAFGAVLLGLGAWLHSIGH